MGSTTRTKTRGSKPGAALKSRGFHECIYEKYLKISIDKEDTLVNT
jgi:hypothetical protein